MNTTQFPDSAHMNLLCVFCSRNTMEKIVSSSWDCTDICSRCWRMAHWAVCLGQWANVNSEKGHYGRGITCLKTEMDETAFRFQLCIFELCLSQYDCTTYRLQMASLERYKEALNDMLNCLDYILKLTQSQFRLLKIIKIIIS